MNLFRILGSNSPPPFFFISIKEKANQDRCTGQGGRGAAAAPKIWAT